MADEIRLQDLTGLANVKAAIYDENGLFWDGSSKVDVSTLTDVEWRAGLEACTEKQTGDGTGTGLYTADKPATLPDDLYFIVFYDAAAPSPDDVYIGTQDDPLEYTDKTGYALSSSGLDLVLVDGKTLPNALEIIAAVAAGKITTAGEATEVFVGLDGLTTRVSATVDEDGNRSAVAYS
jgi:hypothetical protein